MKKFYVPALVLFVGLIVMNLACGVGGARYTCQKMVTETCQRHAQCATADPATQSQLGSSCIRNIDPDRVCGYLTPNQERDLQALEQTGCLNSMNTCACTADGKVDCGAICGQAINNGFGALSAR